MTEAALAALGGAIIALSLGLFGGGGFLIVPGLMASTLMTLANAAASLLMSVLIFGLATSATYAASGRVDVPALLAGGLIGVLAARQLAPKLAGHALLARRLFAAMVIVTALYVGWRALG